MGTQCCTVTNKGANNQANRGSGIYYKQNKGFQKIINPDV